MLGRDTCAGPDRYECEGDIAAAEQHRRRDCACEPDLDDRPGRGIDEGVIPSHVDLQRTEVCNRRDRDPRRVNAKRQVH